MAGAARSGAPAEAAELRLQLEAHARLSAQWGAKASKLLERLRSLQQRSNSPGGCLAPKTGRGDISFRPLNPVDNMLEGFAFLAPSNPNESMC